MNILYVANINKTRDTGVTKKILSQISALESLNNKVLYIYYKDKILYNNIEQKKIKISSNKILREIKIIKEYINIIRNNDIQLIYIRHFFVTPQILKLLRIAKKRRGFGC